MIRRRPSAGLRLQLMLPLLALTIGLTWAQAEKAENKASVDSSAILESVLCVVRSNPTQCIREQAGRMLNNWEDILETKKLEMMGEADKLFERRNEQRGLSEGDDDPQSKQRPSTLMSQIEDGLELVSEFVADSVDSYASDEGTTKDAEGARPKKHLHHIIHKLGKRKGKKKKTYMKLFILAAALKGKIELLLKILSFKLQLKFFAIAAIGLLINIARFWIDLKKQPSPQKVIYYEHAQHQHHYDDHGDDYGGGYWKRSLHGVPDDDSSSSNGFYDRNDRVDDEYAAHRAYPQPQQQQQQHPHYVQQQTPNSPSHYPYDPHSMAYHQQRPYV